MKYLILIITIFSILVIKLTPSWFTNDHNLIIDRILISFSFINLIHAFLNKGNLRILLFLNTSILILLLCTFSGLEEHDVSFIRFQSILPFFNDFENIYSIFFVEVFFGLAFLFVFIELIVLFRIWIGKYDKQFLDSKFGNMKDKQ